MQFPPNWVLLLLQAEARIQKAYQRLSSSKGPHSVAGTAGGQYTGVLGQLIEKGQLSLDLIKANITELMAGGVDTVCLLIHLFIVHGLSLCHILSDTLCRPPFLCNLLYLSWDATLRCRRGWGSKWGHHAHRQAEILRKPCRGHHCWKPQSKRFSGTWLQKVTYFCYIVFFTMLWDYLHHSAIQSKNRQSMGKNLSVSCFTLRQINTQSYFKAEEFWLCKSA